MRCSNYCSNYFVKLLLRPVVSWGKEIEQMSDVRVQLTEEQKRTLAIARLARACGVVLGSVMAQLPDSDVLNYIADRVERGDK